MMQEIVLGMRYRDRVSGWMGIATARYEYMNGCMRIELSASKATDPEPASFVFDIQQLEYIDDGLHAVPVEVPIEARRMTGGPQTNAPVSRGREESWT